MADTLTPAIIGAAIEADNLATETTEDTEEWRIPLNLSTEKKSLCDLCALCGFLMKIAKIVSSNSHIDYIGRVIDELDSDEPPKAEDFGFAQWVKVPMADGEVVGVIYDSKLVNPEYANFGPRLSPKPSLANFTPDYLNEQGILLGILLLGSLDRNGDVQHEIPRRVVPAGQDVFMIDDAAVKKFHTDANGSVRLHYYSQVIAHAGLFAVPLLEAIIKRVSVDLSEPERQRLAVLVQNLEWQRTFGAVRA